jgi:hypothetical protein
LAATNGAWNSYAHKVGRGRCPQRDLIADRFQHRGDALGREDARHRHVLLGHPRGGQRVEEILPVALEDRIVPRLSEVQVVAESPDGVVGLDGSPAASKTPRVTMSA